jgi:hypothetical protein
VPTISLSFLRKQTLKEVCRVCHERAELRTERLCAGCAQVKARVHLRITQQPADGDSSRPVEQCTRSGCICPPCGRRILDPHPFRPSDPARDDVREIHFHPRCHALWLEVVTGLAASSSQGRE